MHESHETFIERLAGVLSRDDVLDVELAYVISKHAHRPDHRKELGPDGKPPRYFEHPRRVGSILIDEAECLEPALMICALLHDGIEDTTVVNYERVKRRFAAFQQQTGYVTEAAKEGRSTLEDWSRQPDLPVVYVSWNDASRCASQDP